MSRHSLRKLAPAVVVAVALAAPVAAEGPRSAVPGEKLDSGLGALPHYREWAQHPRMSVLAARMNAVPGEKLDSGLGELKPYLLWADNTGRTRAAIEVASRR